MEDVKAVIKLEAPDNFNNGSSCVKDEFESDASALLRYYKKECIDCGTSDIDISTKCHDDLGAAVIPFTPSGALDNHVVNYTTEHPGLVSDEQNKCDVEKHFLSETCGKSFAQGSSLTKHTTTHTGKTPCKWDICGKSEMFKTPCPSCGYLNHAKKYSCECGYSLRAHSQRRRTSANDECARKGANMHPSNVFRIMNSIENKMAQLKGAGFDCLFLARPTGKRKRVHVTMRPGSDVVATGLESHRGLLKEVYSKMLDVAYNNKEKHMNSVIQPQLTAVNYSVESEKRITAEQSELSSLVDDKQTEISVASGNVGRGCVR